MNIFRDLRSKVFLILAPAIIYGQNLLSGPECIMLDEPRDRYIVSSFYNNRLVAIDMDGNQTLFRDNVPHCLSFDIQGDTLFVSTGTSVTFIDLASGNVLDNIHISGIQQLDGLLYHEGHLYVLEYNGIIYRIRLSDHTVWPYVQDAFPGSPQDIIHDDVNDRLLFCTYNGSTVLWGIDAADSTIYPVIETGIGGFDGLAQDAAGNLYMSSWNSNAVHMYNPIYTHPPLTVFQGSSGVANLSVNRRDGILAIPLFDEDSVILMPLPSEYLAASFSAEPISGAAPLEVQFSDDSYALPTATHWDWDFQADDIIDLTDPAPDWTYTQAGIYSVNFNITNAAGSSSLLRERYIHVFEEGSAGLFFNGSNARVASDSASLANLQDDFSVAAWIHPLGWGEDAVYGGGIISKAAFNIMISEDAAGSDQHCVFVKLNHSSGTPSFHQSELNSIWLDNWLHIGVTYDASNSNLNIYINGEV